MDSIGNLATALVAQADREETVSSTQLASRPIAGVPQTMAECEALRSWALSLPMVQSVNATPEQIGNHMTFLSATLPTQGHDEDAGRRRFAVYASLLAGWSNEAIAFMCREACRRLRWFPVPAQMLEILNEYRAPEGERSATLRLCSAFANDAFSRWINGLRDGQRIGDAPEAWLRSAAEQLLIRKLDDGSYVERALYQGPLRPWKSLEPPKRSIKALIPNKDDYLRMLAIDEAEMERRRAAQVALDAEEDWGSDMLRAAVSDHAAMYGQADPTKPVEEIDEVF